MINLKFKTIALLMMFVCTVSASDMVPLIGGKISDIDSGESLPFAKVQIKDTTRIATANQDGSFTIFNIPVGSILIITKMGYENEQIKVRSGDKRLIVNLVKLETDNFIEEVVVTGAASSSMMQQSGISQNLLALCQIWVSRTSFARCSYYQGYRVQMKALLDLLLEEAPLIRIWFYLMIIRFTMSTTFLDFLVHLIIMQLRMFNSIKGDLAQNMVDACLALLISPEKMEALKNSTSAVMLAS